MKISVLLVVLLPLISCSAARSMPVNDDWQTIKASEELRPWFRQIRDRITQPSTFKATIKSLKTPISVWFRPSPNGDIETIKVIESSGMSDTDEVALDLVRKAAPFIKAPNRLPSQRGLTIIFVADNLYPNHLGVRLAHREDQSTKPNSLRFY